MLMLILYDIKFSYINKREDHQKYNGFSRRNQFHLVVFIFDI